GHGVPVPHAAVAPFQGVLPSRLGFAESGFCGTPLGDVFDDDEQAPVLAIHGERLDGQAHVLPTRQPQFVVRDALSTRHTRHDRRAFLGALPHADADRVLPDQLCARTPQQSTAGVVDVQDGAIIEARERHRDGAVTEDQLEAVAHGRTPGPDATILVWTVRWEKWRASVRAGAPMQG